MVRMKILVLNCGSSSLKYQIIDMNSNQTLCAGLAERIGESRGRIRHEVFPGTGKGAVFTHNGCFVDHESVMEHVVGLITGGESPVAAVAEIGAVGHRVVHGGERFREPTRITPEVIETIRALSAMAPLHNPGAVMGMAAAIEFFPDAPQVAVFDTAFHATIPDYAFLFPLPMELYTELGVRRYGFHGASHACVAKKLAGILGKPFEKTSCITVHLGNGCSMAAVKNGACVDTSMGLTPLAGLMMGTRSGDVDPSLHEFLSKNKGLSVKEIDGMLNKQSGLKGICGFNDMRDVHAARARGDARAELAFKMFCHRVKQYIGAYLGILGGCDGVVFTAGIGENDPDVRRQSCDTLGSVGIKVDSDLNYGAVRGRVTRISAEDSMVSVYVIPTNEELEIAMQTFTLVRAATHR